MGDERVVNDRGKEVVRWSGYLFSERGLNGWEVVKRMGVVLYFIVKGEL